MGHQLAPPARAGLGDTQLGSDACTPCQSFMFRMSSTLTCGCRPAHKYWRMVKAAMPKPQPVIWSHTVGRGKVIYDALGHDSASLWTRPAQWPAHPWRGHWEGNIAMKSLVRTCRYSSRAAAPASGSAPPDIASSAEQGHDLWPPRRRQDQDAASSLGDQCRGIAAGYRCRQ